MTSSSLIKALFAAIALSALAGCIADTAEDSDLPWASSKSWEGMAPIAPSVMDRYD
jgi:hypothetical protein